SCYIRLKKSGKLIAGRLELHIERFQCGKSEINVAGDDPFKQSRRGKIYTVHTRPLQIERELTCNPLAPRNLIDKAITLLNIQAERVLQQFQSQAPLDFLSEWQNVKGERAPLQIDSRAIGRSENGRRLCRFILKRNAEVAFKRNRGSCQRTDDIQRVALDDKSDGEILVGFCAEFQCQIFAELESIDELRRKLQYQHQSRRVAVLRRPFDEFQQQFDGLIVDVSEEDRQHQFTRRKIAQRRREASQRLTVIQFDIRGDSNGRKQFVKVLDQQIEIKLIAVPPIDELWQLQRILDDGGNPVQVQFDFLESGPAIRARLNIQLDDAQEPAQIIQFGKFREQIIRHKQVEE